MTDTFAATLAAVQCEPINRFAVFRLEDPQLGILDLTAPGYVVSNFVIGHPAEREVARDRALNDGRIDDTSFVGGRAVTFTVRFDTRVLPHETLLDRLKAFMSPRRRPLLVWSYFGTPDSLRTLQLRAVDAPVAMAGSRFPEMPCTWKSPWAFQRAYAATCVVVVPTQASEAGRTYDLTFPREYPAQLPVGSFIANNVGNERADWTATIAVGAAGTVVDPVFSVNGVDMSFDQNSGLTLLAGQTLIVDTAARSVLLNGDPTEPRFDRLNFLDWNWEDLQLAPGTNLVSFTHEGTSTEAFATICWTATWL